MSFPVKNGSKIGPRFPDPYRSPGVPESIEFQTKPEIALQQIRQALEQQVPVGVVLADAGYGNGTPFRAALTQRGLQYIVGIESSTTVWEPGQQPLPAPARKPGRGAPPKRLQRNADHRPISAKQLALGLPSSAWQDIAWRPGSQETLRSRFAAVRVRPGHRAYKRTEPHPEQDRNRLIAVVVMAASSHARRRQRSATMNRRIRYATS